MVLLLVTVDGESGRRWKGDSMLNSSWSASAEDGRVKGVQYVRDHWVISMAKF